MTTTQTPNIARWSRVTTGLYVDPTGKWVATKDGSNYWTVRELTGWGPLPEWSDKAGTLFPDYGDTIHGDYMTLAECKASVARYS